ncbi:hypothetical protein [uncultured Anaerococcus sp.]|uniref:hypothetical protein n=1 Tax=uncultured Anaerococcus sp. TaxID=293428 RepID=UPI0026325CBC|nr:hypothetical protein [uncultured Anaerococcus sp.]
MENRKSKFTACLSSIIAGIVVAMVVYFGLNFAGFKEYRATSKLVTTSVENLNEESPSKGFADTLTSKVIRERTLENLQIDWPDSKLNNKLELTAIESSPIIEISVKDTNKLRAEDLADEYAELSMIVINNIYNTGASVMEYSYQNARVINNTLNYAAYAGLLGFLIYLVISLVGVSRHNHKLKESQGKNYKKSEEAAKAQVKKNKAVIEEDEELVGNDDLANIRDEDFDKVIKKDFTEDLEEIGEEKEVKEETRPLEPIKEKEEENLAATRKIDSKDIDMTAKADEKEESILDKEDASKLEILGKLPKYKRGALDV